MVYYHGNDMDRRIPSTEMAKILHRSKLHRITALYNAPSPSGKAGDFDSSIAGFDVITIVFCSIKCGDSYFVGRFSFVVLLAQ